MFLGIQNRKILEDLELKKQLLLKTGAVPTPPTIAHPTTPVRVDTVNRTFIDTYFGKDQNLGWVKN